MSIYRAYDIRGAYPEEIDKDTAYKIALAYSKIIRPKKVVIGMDLRSSSMILHNSFIRGLRDAGVNVTSIGACTTPMLYFAGFNYKFDGAVMITASHLAGYENGFKLCKERAIPLSGPTGIYKIEKLVKQDIKTGKRKGSLRKRSIKTDYHKFLKKFIKKTKLKIAIDAGNGMGYLDVEVLKKIADVKVIYNKPDFSFPNHIANPAKRKNRTALKRLMKKGKFDLGILLDGDCDRIGFIDDKARFIPMDHVTGMLAQYLLSKKKGTEPIIYEVRSTLAVDELIRLADGKPIMSKAGHSFMKQEMIKHDALFGGEKSGHYFFKTFSYADNALLAAITLINYIQDSKRPVSELAAQFNIYRQIEETNFKVKDKDKTIKKVENYYKTRAKIKKLDGISVYLKNGWFNLRKSNTEELLRLNAEAIDKKELAKIKKQVTRWLR